MTIRVSQHKNNVETAQGNSAVFFQYRDHGHQVSWKNSSEIFIINNFYTINLIESIIIKLTFNQNMNISFGLYYTDKILDYFINKKLQLKKYIE